MLVTNKGDIGKSVLFSPSEVGRELVLGDDGKRSLNDGLDVRIGDIAGKCC